MTQEERLNTANNLAGVGKAQADAQHEEYFQTEMVVHLAGAAKDLGAALEAGNVASVERALHLVGQRICAILDPSREAPASAREEHEK